MQTLETARTYGRIAWLRRQVLLQLALRRVVAGVVAALAALVALGFGTAAAYMGLRLWMGPIGAAAIAGAGWLLIAAVAGIYAGSTPRSTELDALEQMEVEARERTAVAVERLTGIGARAEAMSGTLTLLFALFRALRRMGRRGGDAPDT